MTSPQRPGNAAPPRAPRMTLTSITRGRLAAPLRVILYGTSGVGKTTFGAEAPAPIFLGPEDGSALFDVARFPQPETWTDVLDALRALTNEEHTYKTLVIDSLDWLEPLCHAHVCATARKSSIEDFGYGKGYVAALESWRVFVAALDALRRARRMHIVLIAHAVIAPYRNPEGEDYDRFALKLHKSASGLLTEWCDELIFANHRTHAVKVDPKGTRGRGYGGDERVAYTARRAAFDAKSRHGLPAEMPLSWSEFFAHTQRNGAELVANLRTEIEGALTSLNELDADACARARAVAAQAPDDAAALSVILNRVRTTIAARSSSSSNNGGNATTTTNG